MKTLTAQSILVVCEANLNQVETPRGSNKSQANRFFYGIPGPWCAMWVSMIFSEASKGDSPLAYVNPAYQKGFCYVPDIVAWARKKGYLITNHAEILPADIVCFDFSGAKKIAQHVGIAASKVSNGKFLSYEGNTSSGDKGSQDDGDTSTKKYRTLGTASYVIRLPQIVQDGKASSPVVPPPPSFPKWPGRYYTLTSPETADNNIKVFQTQMLKRGWKTMPVTGKFDVTTYNLVKAFQKEKGLTADGVVGLHTWNAAWLTKVT